MPRVTSQAQAARRERVGGLWVRGLSLSAIARAANCEWRTVKRDVALLAKQTADEWDVAGELHRLLLAGRAIEAAAWISGDHALALAGQKQTLSVVQVLQSADVEHRLQALEQALGATAIPSLGVPLVVGHPARGGDRGGRS